MTADPSFGISAGVIAAADRALEICEPVFREIGETVRFNQQRMLRAFINAKVDEGCFAGTTGYGYGDRGRDTLDRLAADVFGAEDCLFRHGFASGTHTITVGLFGLLRPGDTMLCVTGRPYDTLIGVLGMENDSDGSLRQFGINTELLDLLPNGEINADETIRRLKSGKIKVVYIQRSRGYTLRPSLSVSEIGEISAAVHKVSPGTDVFVDNCYGEFTETVEPSATGADLIAGSLIKNPGGGIAPCGGYIAGRKDLVARCADRMTAPGVGREIGATGGNSREMFLGFYNAPHITGEALKTAAFAAALFEILGFEVSPRYNGERHDIIESVMLGSAERLIAFCEGIQSGSPVDSFARPEPWDMPGYNCKVIMAAGAFTGGSSIELSADAPLREPYAVWMQGGMHFDSAMVGVMLAADRVLSVR